MALSATRTMSPRSSELDDPMLRQREESPVSVTSNKVTSPTGTKKLMKQPAKPRRKWKKPKDKPKRPLSAYNLYFKEERERIINGEVKDCSSTLGFRDMAQFVAKKWNSLKGDGRVKYEKQAMKEKKKYFAAIADWKKKQKDQEAAKQEEKRQAEFANDKEKGENSEAAHSRNNFFKPQPPIKPLKASSSDRGTSMSKKGDDMHTFDMDEPLPIEHPLDMSGDLAAIFNPDEGNPSASFPSSGLDAHANSKRSSDTLIDALQQSLQGVSSSHQGPSLPPFSKCDSSIASLASLRSTPDQHHHYQRHSRARHGDVHQRHHAACTPVMKRVWTTIEAIQADSEFCSFMKTLDWK